MFPRELYLLEKYDHCVDNYFQPIKGEKIIESLYLQRGDGHDFKINSDSYLTRLSGFEQIGNVINTCSMMSR